MKHSSLLLFLLLIEIKALTFNNTLHTGPDHAAYSSALYKLQVWDFGPSALLLLLRLRLQRVSVLPPY